MTNETKLDGPLSINGEEYPSYGHYLASINAKPLEPAELEPLQTAEQAIQNERIVHYCIMHKFAASLSVAIAKTARPLILADYEFEISEDDTRLIAKAPDADLLNAFGAPGALVIHDTTEESPKPTVEPIERWTPSDADIEQQREAAALSVITEFGQQEGLSITDTSLIYNNVKAAIDRGATLYIEGRRLWVREMEGTTADSVVEVNGGPGETWISYSGEAADPDKYLRRGIKPGIPTPEVELGPGPSDADLRKYSGVIQLPHDTVSISDEATLRLYREQLAPEIAKKVVDHLLKSGRFEIRAHEAPAPGLGGSLPEERVETYKYRDATPEKPAIAQVIEHLDRIKELTEIMGERGRKEAARALKLALNRLL